MTWENISSNSTSLASLFQTVSPLKLLNGFRPMFYMILPSESLYSRVEDVPNIVNQTVPYFALLVFFEFVIQYIKGQRRARVGDVIGSVGAGVVSFWPTLFTRSVIMATYIWTYKNFRVYELPWDNAWTWLLALFLVDLGYYWVHRMAHEVNFFWSGHQVHHSSEEYNLTTALRQSLLQDYFSWIFYLPIALFVPPSVFLTHKHFNLIYQFWIHTELVDRLGPLEWILNTPSHHRVHHGRNPYCIDKNYAGFLIIFDRVFGTFQEEKRDDKVVYGLVHPLETYDPVYIQLCHLRYVWKMFLERQKWSDKFYTLVYGPGWEPGKPRLGDPNDLPAVKYDPANLAVFRPSTPAIVEAYCVLHFAVIVIYDQGLIAVKDILPVWVLLIGISFFLMGITSVGWLCEGRLLHGGVLEIVRCTLYLLVDSILRYVYGWPLSTLDIVMQVLFTTSALLWCVCLSFTAHRKLKMRKSD